MRAMGGFVLGSVRKDFNTDQFERFIAAYSAYFIADNYGRLKEEFTIEYPEGRVFTTEGENGVDCVVRVLIRLKKQAIRLGVRTRQTQDGGAVRIVDLEVEGVSFALTKRDEFRSYFRLSGGDPERLIAELAKRGQ